MKWVKQDVENLLKDIQRGAFFVRDNMTSTERMGLKSLLEDNTIILKPADKGSSIVVMDRIAYIKEIERHLSDSGIITNDLICIPVRTKQNIQDVVSKYASLNVIDKKW